MAASDTASSAADPVRILELFFLPPQAIGRLGGSPAPMECYVWNQDLTIAGASPTVIDPAISLEVDEDGSVRPYLPGHLRFKDGALFRPVAPFLELWAKTSHDGKTVVEEPVTSQLLRRVNVSVASLVFSVSAANRKAARRCGDDDCRFFANARIVGTDHAPYPLLAISPNRPGGQPLVTADKPIPLGRVQVIRPLVGIELGINLDIVRVRFTPATGQVYGPPAATVGIAPGTQRSHMIVKPENRILNPDAAWAKYDANGNQFQNPQPQDTYDGSDTDAERSWGVVDDTCDVLVQADLIIQGGSVHAEARIFVGPPDFAPDRRPFVSLADDLTDRDQPQPPTDESLDNLERRINDLFQRVWETAGLMNIDAVRNRALNGGDQVPPVAGMPRTDFGSMTGEDRPFARLSADLYKDRAALNAASVEHHRLPLAELIERAHSELSDLYTMLDKLRESADHIRELVRPPYGRVRELDATPGTSQSQKLRDIRIDRDTEHDMRMPPYMRDSDATAMSLTHRQYFELLGFLSQLESAHAQVHAQLQAATSVTGAQPESGRVHPVHLDTPIRRKIASVVNRLSTLKQQAKGVSQQPEGLVAKTSLAIHESPRQEPADQPPSGKIFPLNLTARAEHRITGNPEATRLESGVGNCFPGLEYDHRNLDRRFMPGLLVEFVSADSDTNVPFQGGRVLGVNPADPDLIVSSLATLSDLTQLRADLTAASDATGTGTWFMIALEQGGVRIELTSPDTAGTGTIPMDGMAVWRLVRSLEPGKLTVEIAVRTMPDNQPLPPAIILHGWRRRFVNESTGVISRAYQVGELTQSLCSPWTHDFRDCGCIYWASNHPDVVRVEDRPDDLVLSGGRNDDPAFGLNRVRWLRTDRSRARTPEARETQQLNRLVEMDHYEINQRWQDLAVVIGNTEVFGVYRRQEQDHADPFNNARDMALELTKLATLEHALAVEYLYAYYSVRTPEEVPDSAIATALRQDVTFIRHFIQLVAVGEMQHLRAANQLLWELAEHGFIDRTEFGPSLGISATIPTDRNQHVRPTALRPLTLDTLRDFVAVERPSGQIEGAYSRVVATLRQPQYPDSLFQLAARIVNEGQEHFLRFREIEAAMRQYRFDSTSAPWLRDLKLADPKQAEIKPAMKLYRQIVTNLQLAYATGSVTDRPHITQARIAMTRLDEACDALAKGDGIHPGLGVPFLDL
jgi:hypothetical protein